MFTLYNVSKSYGDTRVFNAASCSIPAEGLTVIMGPSGSGKSTLLRLLALLEIPDSGVVSLSLNGSTYESSTSARPWPDLTCVFQRQFLWPHLTLRENILLPLTAKAVPEPQTRLGAVVEQFSMHRFIDRYPNEVSGGQAQRAALARAFALKPKVMLIDEAHTGLDIEQQESLNLSLRKMAQSGVALMVVSHSVDFAYRYARNLIVVESGDVMSLGAPSDLDHSKSHTPFMRALSRRVSGEQIIES